MEGYDIISDSYSQEMLIVLVAERIYSRIVSFWEERHSDTRRSMKRRPMIAWIR
jgi:hypothetical protein